MTVFQQQCINTNIVLLQGKSAFVLAKNQDS